MRNNIRTMRLLSDLSLNEVAQHLSVDSLTLREWENDASLLPTLPNIQKERLSTLFRMSDDEIQALFLPLSDITPDPRVNNAPHRKARVKRPMSARQHLPAETPAPRRDTPLPIPTASQRTCSLPSGGQISLSLSVNVLALVPRERHLVTRLLEILDDLCSMNNSMG